MLQYQCRTGMSFKLSAVLSVWKILFSKCKRPQTKNYIHLNLFILETNQKLICINKYGILKLGVNFIISNYRLNSCNSILIAFWCWVEQFNNFASYVFNSKIFFCAGISNFYDNNLIITITFYYDSLKVLFYSKPLYINALK